MDTDVKSLYNYISLKKGRTKNVNGYKEYMYFNMIYVQLIIILESQT